MVSRHFHIVYSDFFLNISTYNAFFSHFHLFHNDRCGHCKAMAADWIELGKAMSEEKPDLLIGEGENIYYRWKHEIMLC